MRVENEIDALQEVDDNLAALFEHLPPRIDERLVADFHHELDKLDRLGYRDQAQHWRIPPEEVVPDPRVVDMAGNVTEWSRRKYAVSARFRIKVTQARRYVARLLARETERRSKLSGLPAEPAQRELLDTLVAAWRNVPANQRQEFHVLAGDGKRTFYHPGLRDRSIAPSWVDVSALEREGLIVVTPHPRQRGNWSIEITAKGFDVHDQALEALGRTAEIQPASPAPDPNAKPTQTLLEGRRYHAAVSYAATEQALAERLTQIVEAEGYRVFYDRSDQADLWGEDMGKYLADVYTNQALYCVLFASQEYAERIWTNHELQSALVRQIREKGAAYILPVQVDGTTLDGPSANINYVSMERYSVEEIAAMLIEKLRRRPGVPVTAV
ncbi:MAG: TIR domain-containing protein [Chloroflexota bacterium]|nr:TIR domain-containing protein [Chloroflexota bacterium]